MKFKLPLPGAAGKPCLVPPKYMEVLDVLRDEGEMTAAEVGAGMNNGHGDTVMTRLAHGRLRSLLAVDAVARIDTDENSKPLRPIRWRITTAGRQARLY